MAAVGAGDDRVVGEGLPLVDVHLEEAAAVGALAAEEAVFVGRDRDRRLKALARLAEVGDAVRESMLPAHAAIQAAGQD